MLAPSETQILPYVTKDSTDAALGHALMLAADVFCTMTDIFKSTAEKLMTGYDAIKRSQLHRVFGPKLSPW